jgi:uncharacterized protein YceK
MVQLSLKKMGSINVKREFSIILLIITCLSGCSAFQSVESNKPHASITSAPTVTSSPTISSSAIKQEVTPTPMVQDTNVWEYADTHNHPFEGILTDYKIENGKLITITVKPTVALKTPTDPLKNSTQKFDVPYVIKVRDDVNVSSRITDAQKKLLILNGKYIVRIDDWVYKGDHFLGTTIETIYYEVTKKFFSLKDNSDFSECGIEGCKRITN